MDPNNIPAGHWKVVKTTHVVKSRVGKYRSVTCQVRPQDIPDFLHLKNTGTESDLTGVRFHEDYDLLRSKVQVPILENFARKQKRTYNMNGQNVIPVIQAPYILPCFEHQDEMSVAGEIVQSVPEEKKYEGPLIHGKVPEMIVSSGALGMTDTHKKYYRKKFESRKRIIHKDLESFTAIPQKLSRTELTYDSVKIEDKYKGPNLHDALDAFDASIPCSSSSISLKKPQSNAKEISSSLNSLKELTEHFDKKEFDLETDYLSNPASPIVSVFSEEEIFQKEMEEKARYRFKEIGRRICELDLTDFACERSKHGRKAFTIASRGEEILNAVKRNLNVIHDKLGEFAKGTIFEHIDTLIASFGNTAPNAMTRLNKTVTEKLQQKAASSIYEHSVPSSIFSHPIEAEPDEPIVKREPPENADVEN